jgi:hypothetical protein
MKPLFFLFLTLFTIVSCRKEKPQLIEDDAVLTGFDARLCPCCGGWFIEIEDTIWRFDNTPAVSNVDLNAHVYPLPVKVIWKKKDHPCLGDEIEVSWLMQR